MSANNRQVGGTHYQEKTIQPWDAMQSWMTQDQFEGFLRGNVIKYVARATDLKLSGKCGVQDLEKARHYLDKLIEVAK